MSKHNIPSAEDKRRIVSEHLEGLIGELRCHTNGEYSLLTRNDNGKYDDIESYWIYWGDRRFAKLDVYYQASSQEVAIKTKDYLYYITDHHYSMTPFVVYITYDKGSEFFLYRRGPSLQPLEYNDFLSLMCNFYWQDKEKGIKKNKEIIQSYIDNILTIIDNSSLINSKKETVKQVFTIDAIDYSINTDVISLTPSAEKAFFMALLESEQDKDFNTICRYTSVNSLFRTLNDKKASMLSIVCMNDISECSYVNEFLTARGCDISENTWKENNRFFIVSCADILQSDDLMMWNMYGDHAEGVCIHYSIDDTKVNERSGFNLARISYGAGKNEHEELELIASLLNSNINEKRFMLNQLGTWQHFF